MDYNQLEYFVNVAKTQNMGASAEVLHITQPALSMSIKRLENELGVNLFDRHNHTINLNSYGRIFLRYAEASLKELRDGKNQLKNALDSKKNKISIMCPVYYLTGLLFDAFCEVNPNVSVEYHFFPYWMIEEALINTELDICITSSEISNPMLENEFLTDRAMGVLCYLGHQFQGRDHITVNDLRNERLLSFSETKTPRYDLDIMCSKRGFQPDVVFESDSFSTLVNMCRKGKGLIRSSYESTKLIDMTGLFFVPFEPSELDAHARLYMVTRKNDSNPFMEQYKEVIRFTLTRKPKTDL